MDILWLMYLLLLLGLQLFVPVLLIRRFKWSGILSAMGFTFLLHGVFFLNRKILNPDMELDIVQMIFVIVPLGLGLVYCLISILIAGALENRAAIRKG